MTLATQDIPCFKNSVQCKLHFSIVCNHLRTRAIVVNGWKPKAKLFLCSSLANGGLKIILMVAVSNVIALSMNIYKISLDTFGSMQDILFNLELEFWDLNWKSQVLCE